MMRNEGHCQYWIKPLMHMTGVGGRGVGVAKGWRVCRFQVGGRSSNSGFLFTC